MENGDGKVEEMVKGMQVSVNHWQMVTWRFVWGNF